MLNPSAGRHFRVAVSLVAIDQTLAINLALVIDQTSVINLELVVDQTWVTGQVLEARIARRRCLEVAAIVLALVEIGQVALAELVESAIDPALITGPAASAALVESAIGPALITGRVELAALAIGQASITDPVALAALAASATDPALASATTSTLAVAISSATGPAGTMEIGTIPAGVGAVTEVGPEIGTTTA